MSFTFRSFGGHSSVPVGSDETLGESFAEIKDTADGTIPDKRFCEIDSSGDLVVGTVDSDTVAGVNKSGAQVTSTNEITVGTTGQMKVTSDQKVDGGALLKCGYQGKALQLLTTAMKDGTMQASGATAGNFSNQPADDGIELVSDDADDVNTVDIYGTTNGADTVVKETVTLTGTDAVSTTKVDWGCILAVVVNGEHEGTITVREASGDLAITTLATGTNSVGYVAVSTETRAFNKKPVVVAGGASTKQVGIIGTSTSGATQYDSQALNGTSDVEMNSAFNTVTALLMGDVATGTTVTLKQNGTADDWTLCAGKAGPAGASGADVDLWMTR